MDTTILNFHVERKDISYLRWLIESYDGMAFLRTIDPHQAFIELEVSQGCESIVSELLDSLRLNEHMKIIPVDGFEKREQDT